MVSKYDFKKIKLSDSEGGKNKITMSFSDNQRLKKSILECLPEFQKTALIFSLGNPDSLDLIQNKVEELKKRLVNVALSMTLHYVSCLFTKKNYFTAIIAIRMQ